ncbi:MAG: dTMP kinase [Bacteroidales bacterium]|nr:dTMP kinase [Bacteroidales bacterium]MDD2264756.1 dTMP kinase [Bacteroidales bacterium]MDD2831854.1 dTMP kinase [Bacteroidales bacterium]MDD3209147.1 dTMP kinase [Bacteroidales bacterium]MDD3697977.1 dTMP kinase [Bacteroidales bacterium]
MLIVLEGLDGAGKSTQLKAMEVYLKERGQSVHFMHFPRYDTPVYGTLIARFLRGDSGAIDTVDPYLVSLLFAGNRLEMAGQIKGWLEDGDIVLLDRYVYSNIAFQCAKFTSREERERLRNFIFQMEYQQFGIPKPDVNLFLDVPLHFVEENLGSPRSGDDRTYLEGKDDIHEASVDFQQRVREVYLEQAKFDSSFRIIPCSDLKGEIAHWTVIFERIKPYLP